MTTIAYNHKAQEVAVDSRSSKGNGLCNDDTLKIIHVKAVTFILCGSICDFDFFVNNYEKYKKTGVEHLSIDCEGIMIRDGKPFHVFVHEDIFNEEPLSCNETYGSGGHFALAAMDFGKSTRDSVEYAATRDIYTGGKIRVLDIATMVVS